MILFWDKNLPKTIPQALLTLNLSAGTEYYLSHFPLSDTYKEGGDDWWLARVGAGGWTVLTQDWSFHTKDPELRAVKDYKIGCFYLWGPKAPKWEILRCFARAYDRIIEADAITPKPFIYWVSKTGILKPEPIP